MDLVHDATYWIRLQGLVEWKLARFKSDPNPMNGDTWVLAFEGNRRLRHSDRVIVGHQVIPPDR